MWIWRWQGVQAIFFSLHVQLAFGMGKNAIVCIGDRTVLVLHLVVVAPAASGADAQCVLFCAQQLCTMTSFGYGMGQVMVDSLRQVTKKSWKLRQRQIRWSCRTCAQLQLINSTNWNCNLIDLKYFPAWLASTFMLLHFSLFFHFRKIPLSRLSIANRFFGSPRYQLLPYTSPTLRKNTTFNL